jgi:putative acyl-CoA dehydrogenase
VLRAIAREPASLDAYWEQVSLAAGADPRLDASITALRAECDDLAQIEIRARRLVERLALVFQGSLLVRYAPAPVADAFCASRLGGETHRAFGTLPRGVDTGAIIDRARPIPV